MNDVETGVADGIQRPEYDDKPAEGARESRDDVWSPSDSTLQWWSLELVLFSRQI